MRFLFRQIQCFNKILCTYITYFITILMMFGPSVLYVEFVKPKRTPCRFHIEPFTRLHIYDTQKHQESLLKQRWDQKHSQLVGLRGVYKPINRTPLDLIVSNTNRWIDMTFTFIACE